MSIELMARGAVPRKDVNALLKAINGISRQMGYDCQVEGNAKNYPGFTEPKGISKLFGKISGALRHDRRMEIEDMSIQLRFTDNGIVYVRIHGEEGKAHVSINSKTSFMGPGFHKFTCEFIDRLSNECGIKFEVEDDTDYYTVRDFNLMRTTHFLPWLQEVSDILMSESAKDSHLAIFRDIDWPIPENIPGSLITPFGRYDAALLRSEVRKKGIDVLADVLYPCWEENIDMTRVLWFEMWYKLWNKCYFRPSSRSKDDESVNMEIISLIERIIASKANYAIPHNEYLELCRLSAHKPVSLDGVGDYRSEYVIGYRKGILLIGNGNVHFKIPGWYICDIDDDTSIYWGEEDGEVIHVSAETWDDRRSGFVCSHPESIIKEGKICNGRYILIDRGHDEGSHVTQIELITKGQITMFTLASVVGVSESESIERAENFISGLAVDQNLN